MGHELDQLERQMLEDAAGPSSNLDESGMFSVQVGSVPALCCNAKLQPLAWCACITAADTLAQCLQCIAVPQDQPFVCNPNNAHHLD